MGLGLLAVGLLVAAPAAGRAPTTVRDTEPQFDGVRLPAAARAGLAELVAAELTASGRFRAAPNPRARAAIRAGQRAGLDLHRGEGSAMALGRELAPAKTLQTRVARVGDTCVVTMTLYDLQTATSERAAVRSGPCGEAALLDALREATQVVAGAPAQAFWQSWARGGGWMPPPGAATCSAPPTRRWSVRRTSTTATTAST